MLNRCGGDNCIKAVTNDDVRAASVDEMLHTGPHGTMALSTNSTTIAFAIHNNLVKKGSRGNDFA
jgi:hypothetical protein